MLALAHTVQTQLDSLPPPPPVQDMVPRFADPKVPDPLAPWPIEAEPELAPILGLFVPSLVVLVQPDVWAAPEPVQPEMPAHMDPAETVPAALDVASCPEEAVTADPEIEISAVQLETIPEPDVATTQAEDLVAAAPEIELAPAAVATIPEPDLATTQAEELVAAAPEIELAPAAVETIPEPEVEVAPAPVATTQAEELVAAAPEIEHAPATVETLPEPEVEAVPVPVETTQAEELVAAAPEIELAPLAFETTQDVAAEVESELAPALGETAAASVEDTPAQAEACATLPIQELVDGALGPVLPKPADTVEFRYPDAEPEFAPITPLVVSSSPGPLAAATAPVANGPQSQVVATPRKGGMPGWVLSLLVATGLSLAGAMIVRNMGFGSKAEPVIASTSQTSETPSGDNSPVYSFARFIEVTGLRVVVDLKNGSQLHYILVNHSPTQLSNLQLRIDVLSTASSDSGKPLFTVSSLVSGLEPSSSREMVANIGDLRDTVIPDWENLKPKVQVVTQ